MLENGWVPVRAQEQSIQRGSGLNAPPKTVEPKIAMVALPGSY